MRYVKAQNRVLNQLDTTEWVPESEVNPSIVHQAMVTLTNAQIKSLPTAVGGFTLVPAQGAGRLLRLISCIYYAHIAVDYGSVDANCYFDLYLDTAAPISNPSLAGSGNVLDPGGGGDVVGFLTPRVILIDPDIYDMYPVGLSSINNQPISLFAHNSGNFSLGDDANTLMVSLTYYVLNLSTGEFE